MYKNKSQSIIIKDLENDKMVQKYDTFIKKQKYTYSSIIHTFIYKCIKKVASTYSNFMIISISGEGEVARHMGRDFKLIYNIC